MMRILWIIDSLGPGGAESLMVPLLQSLKEQNVESRVCVLTVRAGNPIADVLREMGISVDMVPIKNLRNPWDVLRLSAYIRKHRPKIIHTQLETSDVLGTLAAGLLGIPSVSTIHTLDEPAQKMRKRWRNFFRWNFLKKLASRVIFVSETTRQHYADFGFATRKLLTMYNGIDLDRFARNSSAGENKSALFGLPKDSTVFTTVAVLREPKGIQYMLKALPEISAKVPNAYYAIVGDGEYRTNLENLAASLGIADHVVFMSYRSDIPDLLAASDVFVLPTLVDALPTVLFEGMAIGIPIVASNVGGVPEIIENNVSGLLVPPADPTALANTCICLAQDKTLAYKLASAAHDKVLSHFDVRRQAKNLITLYDQMVTEHGN